MSLRARDGGIQILGFGGSPAGNFGGAMTIELSTFIGDIEVRKCSAVIGMLQPITLPPMLIGSSEWWWIQWRLQHLPLN